MRLINILIFLSLSLTLANSDSVFDNLRKGAIHSVGIGVHKSHLSDDNVTTSGVAVAARMGYGINDVLGFHFVADVSYDKEHSNILTGLGITYHLDKTYFVGEMGFRTLFSMVDVVASSATNVKNETELQGIYSLGIGFEYKPHTSIEFNWMKTNLSEREDNASYRILLVRSFY